VIYILISALNTNLLYTRIDSEIQSEGMWVELKETDVRLW